MKPFKFAVKVVVLVGAAGLVGVVLAQGAEYQISRYLVVGGGTSGGGGYGLGAFIGQADAGLLAGGSYTLAGGFGGGTAAGPSPRPGPTPPPASPFNRLYLPLVIR